MIELYWERPCNWTKNGTMKGYLPIYDIDFSDIDLYIDAYKMKCCVENIGRKIFKIKKFKNIDE